MESRSAYNGLQRKLVLAFDVGTTYSGISYSILDPGQVPEIKGVTRFPDQEYITGAAKIPTVIYYDSSGKVQAVGAETMREGIHEQAEDEQWVKAEWFKLHLRPTPAPGTTPEADENIPPLPLNKTVTEVLADFLTYLFECTSSYIQETHVNGIDLWVSVKDEIEFVLSHPNGWEGAQQHEIRKASLLAGLIPDTIAGHERLSLVTEGEASLHFAIQNGLSEGVMKNGEGVMIIDAGGGTIDISSYSRNTTASEPFFEEVAAPQCHFHGSSFVSLRAHLFIKNYLAESSFVNDVEHIVRCFDKTTKLRFRSVEGAQYVKFGSSRDNDVTCSIRFGQLKLLGSDIAQFFKPSIDCIVTAVTDQQKTAHKSISHAVLVGGFSASNYMFNMVKAALAPTGLSMLRPESHVNKAVSDGAISFYLDHSVGARVSKFSYGIFSSTYYDSDQPDHRERNSDTYTGACGRLFIYHCFSIILPMNTRVSETKEFRGSYARASNSPKKLKCIASIPIYCYRGLIADPKWRDVDTNNYNKLCSVDIDLSYIPVTKKRKITGSGTYYMVSYDIILQLGLIELQAQVAWKEGDIEKRAPAKIIYGPESQDDGDDGDGDDGDDGDGDDGDDNNDGAA